MGVGSWERLPQPVDRRSAEADAQRADPTRPSGLRACGWDRGAGSTPGTRGVYYLDAFKSRRVNYIGAQTLQAAFTADLTSGYAPLTVQFSDQSVASGPITSYEWDFGDGSTSTRQNPQPQSTARRAPMTSA